MSDILKIGSSLSVGEMLSLRNRTLDMLPSVMEETTLSDAQYHFLSRTHWIDLNQVDTPRNLHYHRQILDWVGRGAGKNGVILEVGGGVGYDAAAFFEQYREFKAYIFSEISPELSDEVRKTFPDELPVITCALDASSLRILDREVDVLFMIAAFHHILNEEQALLEFDRVVKPGGYIVFGIEPNRFWTGWMKRLKPLYRSIFPGKGHSAGDEEAEGFSKRDFIRIAESKQWKVVELTPVWFMVGFSHYGLEALYRILRLKNRLVLPGGLENLLIRIDDFLFSIPYVDRLAWHYSVCYQKADL